MKNSPSLSPTFISRSACMDHRISWVLMGPVPKGEILSYTMFTFPLFFDFWSLVLLFWLPLDFVMPQHLSCFLIPLPTTFITLSLVHLPSSITLSLSTSFSSSVLSHSLTPSFRIPVFWLLASPFHFILIFPTSVHYSLPPHSNFVYLTFCPLWLCESFSTFSILPCLPYYSKPCSI